MNKKLPIKKNKNQPSNFFAVLKLKLKKFFRKLKKVFLTYPVLSNFLQISFLYFYATVLLMFSVRNSAGFFPDPLYNILPFATEALNLPILKFLATPEKTFLIYFIIMELILNKDFASIILKYNLLLIFVLEMLQNLIISTWDIFVHRELHTFDGSLIFSMAGTVNFFTFFFVFMFFLYIYCYLNAIMFKLVSFPGPFAKITDSVAFWLNIKRIDPNKKQKN